MRLAARANSGLRQLVGELDVEKHATSAKAQRLLGWSPRPPEEAIIASAESLLALRGD